jgi:hypothetical protein
VEITAAIRISISIDSLQEGWTIGRLGGTMNQEEVRGRKNLFFDEPSRKERRNGG